MTTLDIIGTLFEASGTEEAPVATALPGYHVNTTAAVPAWQAYAVTPATPRRAFSGVPTHCYTFADRAQFDAVLATTDLSTQPAPQVRAVTMRQARLWLLSAGLLQAVESVVLAANDPALRIWWDYSSEVHIAAPPLLALLPHIGLSAEQLPGAFAAAAEL